MSTTLAFDILARSNKATREFDRFAKSVQRNGNEVEQFGKRTSDSFSKATDRMDGFSAASREVSKSVTRMGAASEQSARKVSSAEDAVAQAQRAAEDAQTSLTRAREAAAKNIRNLQLELRGAAVAEEAAVLSMERAQARLQEATQFGDAQEVRGAEVALQRTALAVDVARERYAALQAASERASRVGVQGADEVVAAQRRLASAQDRVRAAQARRAADFDRSVRQNIATVVTFGDRSVGALARTANSLSNVTTAAAALNGVSAIVSNLAGVLGLVPAAAASAAAAIGTLAVGTAGFLDGLAEMADSSGAAAGGVSGVADAAEQASRRIEDAERNLARAQQASRDAQENLTRARRQAAEQIEDLALSLKGAALSEEDAALGLERARVRLKEAQKSGASGLDLKEAELGVRQASLAVEEARERYADLRDESARAAKAGVEGSDEVIQAQRQVADAAEGVREAQRQVAEAHADAAKNTAAAGAAAGAATEKFDKLSTNAQATVRALLALNGAWTDVRKSVQDKLFEGVAEEVTVLGTTYLPVLKRGMGDVATEFNAGAISVADFLAEADQVRTVNDLFGGTTSVVGDLSDTFRPLLAIMLDVAAVGAEMLPDLTAGFGAAAEESAAFVANARETGELQEWIEGGLDTIRQLGRLFSNVGAIISTVYRSINAGGEGMLTSLVSITDQMEAFLKSVEGQEALNALGEALRTVGAVVSEVLLTALRELAPVVVAAAPAFAALAAEIGASLVSALRVVGPLLVAAAGFISDNISWLGPLVVALYTAVRAYQAVTTVMRIFNAVAKMNPWTVIISATLALATVIVTQWDRIVGFFKGLPDKLGRALAPLGSVISRVFKGAVNEAIEWLNDGINGINELIGVANHLNPFDDIPHIPHIPKLHTGGRVPGAPGQESVWTLEADETVVPARLASAFDEMAALGGRSGAPAPVSYRPPRVPVAAATSSVAAPGRSVTVEWLGDIDSAFVSYMRKLMRDGQLRLGVS